MEEVISFCTDGEAGPYLIVPPKSYSSLHEFFNTRKLVRSAGDQRGSLVIIEVPAYSAELEKAIDDWFAETGTPVEKDKVGPNDSPSTIKWSYDVK